MGRAQVGLTFDTYSKVERSLSLRADVALFVGFVAPRAPQARWSPADEATFHTWLAEQGFEARAEEVKAKKASVATLAQVPLPIESWSTFDQLFAWEARPVTVTTRAATYLGAAVRAFFAQGGRKAYVVRAGDPWTKQAVAPSDAEREIEQEARIEGLIPDAARVRTAPIPTPLDRTTWRGIAHVFGLEDVSFVLIPDLPDVLDARAARRPPNRPKHDEVFVTCSEEATETAETSLVDVPPPACDESSLRRWAEVVSAGVTFVRRHRPEAQLLAALPLLLDQGGRVSAESPLTRFYEGRLLRGRGASIFAPPPSLEALTSAFLQLATPWLKTLGSASILGGVEPPDGTLAGVLARNALRRGTFRSAAATEVPFVYDFLPDYGRTALLDTLVPTDEAQEGLSLLQRACVFGRAPSGIQLLSDVTTSTDESYRQAGASRLLGAILRAARAIGEEMSFEVSNEATWASIRARFASMLRQLREMNALSGATEDDAFQVRCDRSTMTQADIDAGRLIVHVQMEVAVALEAIRVVLSLTEGGRVSLLRAEGLS